MAKSARKKPVGRPTRLNTRIGREICLRLAEGESLKAICREPGMPVRSTVLRWVIEGAARPEGDPLREFSGIYSRAREIQADAFADELLEVADDGTNDFVEKQVKNGTIILADHEHINRSKLRVQVRQWYAERVLSGKYGQKIAVDSTVHNLTPQQSDAMRKAAEKAMHK